MRRLFDKAFRSLWPKKDCHHLDPAVLEFRAEDPPATLSRPKASAPTNGEAANGRPRPKPKASPRSTDLIADIRKLPCEQLSADYEDYARSSTLSVGRLVCAITIQSKWSEQGKAQLLGYHRAALLTGGTGTGKTTMARLAANAFAEQTQREAVLLEVETHRIATGQRGGTQQNVLRLYEQITEIASAGHPVFVIMNEVESLLVNRGSVSTECNPLDTIFGVNAILEKFDAFPANVFLLMTSNFSSLIDEAALSRVNFQFEVPPPNEAARTRLLLRAVSIINPESESLVALRALNCAESPLPLAQELLRTTEGFSIRQINDMVLYAVFLQDGDESLTFDQLLKAARVLRSISRRRQPTGGRRND